MSIFDTRTDKGKVIDMNGKKDKQDSKGEINAFLGENTNFKGVLAFEGTVRIDGRLEGEIISKDTVIIGENAIVNAEINVGTVIISGKVTGDIMATDSLEITSPGEVHGNIKTPTLLIEKGVIFQGTCEMGHEVEAKKFLIDDERVADDEIESLLDADA